MASKHQKRGNSALDPMMAGFAAGAAAFIMYAMPQARFDEAVSLSGLPMILSAAQPPLGMTARFAAMAAAGIGSFLLVWLVLRALSKPAPKPKHRSGPVEIEMAPPRLRRADAHPDAPSRRPILAGVDLGRPFDEMPVGEHNPADQFPSEEDRPAEALLPAEEQPWDSGGEDEDGETHELAEPGDQYVDQYVDPYVHQYVDQYVDTFEPAYDAQPAPGSFEEEPPQADEWFPPQEAGVDELGFGEPSADEEEQELAEDEPVAGLSAWEEPLEEAEEEELGEAVPLDLSPREVQTVHALSERLAETEDSRSGSIPHLMERLEAGLRRRQPESWLPSAPAHQPSNGTAPASGEAPPQLDARLRGAIQELQKLAARGS